MKNFSFLLKPVFYIFTLICATIIVLKIEQLKPSDLGDYQTIFRKQIIIEKNQNYPLRSTGKLSADDIKHARIAWKYFENNYIPETGLVNGVEGINVCSWNDISSYGFALISAAQLNIIPDSLFNQRVEALLTTVNKLPLVKGTLPNRYYHSKKLIKTDQSGNKIQTAGAWSAIETGRFLGFLTKLNQSYPKHSVSVARILTKWDIDQMIHEGYLYEGRYEDRVLFKYQEGTLGFEEYAAKNFIALGYDATEALECKDFIKFVKIFDQYVGVDMRGDKEHPTKNFINSDPYILDGIEHGWDYNSRELAYRIYNAQKDRFKYMNKLTAAGTNYMGTSLAPLVDCVYSNGQTWCSIKDQDQAMDVKLFSTHVAFGWYCLFDDEYTKLLINKVKGFCDPQKGWYAGANDNDGKVFRSLNAYTNGIILECLDFKKNGRIIGYKRKEN